MTRVTLLVGVVMLCSLGAGCVEDKTRNVAPAKAAAPAAQKQLAKVGAVQDLNDPLLRNRKIKPIATPTRWRATARDQAGTKWDGYLTVEHADENFMQAGYFEWYVERGGGRYHFEGTYNPDTRAVRWTGFTIEERVGAVAAAVYEATLSEDGMRLENGRWSGGISIPGNWVADREN